MEKTQRIKKTNGLKSTIVALAIFVIIIGLSAIFSCSSLEEGKALFEAKCAKCHPLEDSFRETKDLAAWNKTTKVMVRYSEGFITEKEAKKIAKYLAGKNKD